MSFTALVNKGNAVYHCGDYTKAKDYYIEALNIETSCVEALHNLGQNYYLVYWWQNPLFESLVNFVPPAIR